MNSKVRLMKTMNALLLVLFPITTLWGQDQITFQDEFNYKDVYWSNSTWDDATYYRSIDQGRFNMEHRNPEGKYVTYKQVYIEKNKPFTLEADLYMSQGEPGAAVCFLLKDAKSAWYMFEIRPVERGIWCGIYHLDGSFETLNPNTDSDKVLRTNAVKGLKEVNNISIEWTLQEVTMFVNTREVVRIPIAKMGGSIPPLSYIGIHTAKNSQFWVDNIRIKQDITEIKLSDTKQQNFKKTLLPKEVNSETSERTPVISHDGKILYFIRNNHPKNTPAITMDDVWYSVITHDTLFGEAINVGKPINNNNHNAVIAVSADNTSLLLLGVYNVDGSFKKSGLSTSSLTANGWGAPTELVVEDYYNLGKYMEASMSNDGSVLILAIERKDAVGMNDLYVSFRKQNGTYSAPKNMGTQINTNQWEITPFLSADNMTLYFSSDGRNGFGSFDVYVTKRLDETWGNWSEPINLGASVNTTGYDAFFSISASGKYAYMVADYAGDKDIYRLQVPAKTKPEPVVLVNGYVKNGKNKSALESTILIKELETNKSITEFNSSAVDGSYTIVLAAGKKYSFFADKPGYYPVSENVDLIELSAFKEVKMDLYLFPIEKGQTIRLNNIFFDFNKSGLRTESYFELDKLVELMTKNNSMFIELGGHTDNVGDDAYNLQLSDSRIKSVKDYILSKGIQESRLIAKGYGETKPIDSNNTEEGRANNRRVEFTIIEK